MKAIISGASRGIGKAIARELAKMKYDLILLARNESDLEKIRLELSNDKNSIETIAIDLTNKEEILNLESFIQDNSNIELLVNNLGSYIEDQPSNLKRDDLDQMLKTNLYSAVDLTRLVLPKLRGNKDSQIINVGSVMSLNAEKIATSYSISKHAFKAWNDALREELRAESIKVSSIYPGAVNTSSWDGIEADKAAMIQAEDIATMVGSIRQLSLSSLVEEIRMSPLNFHN